MTHLATVLSTTLTAGTYPDGESTPSPLSVVGAGLAALGVILLVAVSLGASALIRRGHNALRLFGVTAATIVVGLLVMWLGGTR